MLKNPLSLVFHRCYGLMTMKCLVGCIFFYKAKIALTIIELAVCMHYAKNMSISNKSCRKSFFHGTNATECMCQQLNTIKLFENKKKRINKKSS